MARLTPLAALLLLGCATDLRDEFPFDGELPSGVYLANQTLDDGSTLTVVDATSKDAWLLIDLHEGRQVPSEAMHTSTEWELGFQRFKIISNGGASGPGSVSVAVLPGVDFDALAALPSEARFIQDAPDGPDSDADVDSPFLIDGGWYAYDLLQHKLQPRDIVYVVRAEDALWKLKLLSYYDSAGSAARPSFRWAPLPPP